MSHSSDASHSPAHTAPYASPALGRRSTLFQVGAGLGIAGFSIALLIFLAACFGFGAALVMSPLPLAMGTVGFVLSIVGGVRDPHLDGSSVAASLFICVATIVGGLLEMAAWQGWRVFA
jgi:hypothetical protein